jgi:hypothetical protein
MSMNEPTRRAAGWKLVPASGDDCLTDGELIGIHVLLNDHCGEPLDHRNVYFRAWGKIMPAVEVALKREGGR